MTAWVPPSGTTTRIQFRPRRYLKSSNAIPLPDKGGELSAPQAGRAAARRGSGGREHVPARAPCPPRLAALLPPAGNVIRRQGPQHRACRLG
jgi:hypothetical protein